MKNIMDNLLRAEGRGFFISAYVGKLEAYKLTENQALEFCSKNVQEGLEPLEADEDYSGFVALKLNDGYWVGKINGKFVWLDPEHNEMRSFYKHCYSTSSKRLILCDSQMNKFALEQGGLFEYKENSKNSCARLLLIRDLDIAGELSSNRKFCDPDGDPEEIDRQIKDKLIALVNGAEVKLCEEEKYLLMEHYRLEYRTIFGEN